MTILLIVDLIKFSKRNLLIIVDKVNGL